MLHKKNIAEAVLIRAIDPLKGIEQMLQRSGKIKKDKTLTKGPGNVSKVLGINKSHSGLSLFGSQIFITDDGFILDEKEIGISKRIGVEGAGDSAQLPLRFYIKGNPFVSGNPAK